MLIDTHLHLANEDYDIEKVMENAENNNVKYLILGGTDKKDNIDSIELSKKYNNIFLTLGYHPEYINEIKEEDYCLIENQITENIDKVLAIGEIGLDYHYDNENKDKQKAMFIRQIDIAKQYNLPVVIHSRDATEDTYNILMEKKVKGIIHCFSGSLEMAKKYIDLGFLLGIGGVVTFKNSNLKEVIKNISLENIVLETDSPYLSPNRGEKNEPMNIKIIAEYIADLKETTLEEVGKTTTNNVKRVFNLKI